MLVKPERQLDTARAQEIWDEYVRSHDLSELKGKVAAVDPAGGGVWIGDSGVAVADKMHADGVHSPVWLVRIGSDYFVRKGRR